MNRPRAAPSRSTTHTTSRYDARGIARIMPVAGATIAGLLTAASFQPFGLGWLAPIALAMLWHNLRNVGADRALIASLAYGLGFMLVLLWWLFESINPLAWIALGIAQAGFVALGVLGVWSVRAVPGGPLWAAVLWTGVESLRSTWPLGGMPWGQLGFSAIDSAWAALLPYVGVPGTSLFIAFAGFTLAQVLNVPARTTLLMGSVAIVAVVVASALPQELTNAGSANVAAIQGGVPGDGTDLVAHHRQVTRNHIDQTLELSDQLRVRGETLDLVVWPENSTAVDPHKDAQARTLIEQAVAAVGAPLLVGGIVEAPTQDRIYNRGILWLPDGKVSDYYTKTHLVPFGEYIPWRAVVGNWSDRFNEVPRDMIAGENEGPIQIDGFRVADAICFDIAYDDVLQSQVRRGAEIAVVQTSNAMFHGTAQPTQQFEITRARAAEIGRTIVVASTNGTTGIIGSRGNVVQTAPSGVGTHLRATVSLQSGLTPAVRHQAVRDGAIQNGALLIVVWVIGREASFLIRRRRNAGLRPTC